MTETPKPPIGAPESFAFDLPFVPAAKKSAYAAFGGRIVLRAAAKREIQAIRDCARAFLAHRAGAMDDREFAEFVEDAMHFRAGNIAPKKWAARCEPIEAYALTWRKSPVTVEIQFFRDAGGAATEGTTRVTIKRLPWDLHGDVRKLVDVDGSATTILDALQGFAYSNDRQVESMTVYRFREDVVQEHGAAPLTQRSPS